MRSRRHPAVRLGWRATRVTQRLGAVIFVVAVIYAAFSPHARPNVHSLAMSLVVAALVGLVIGVVFYVLLPRVKRSRL